MRKRVTVGSGIVRRRPAFVTTSWDDGDILDMKVADELRSRGMAGTFYIPTSYDHHNLLSTSDLRKLSSPQIEIGAHSASHPDLSRLPISKMAYEVGSCKQLLEDQTGREVRMFCYPFGRYNDCARQCVSESGYAGARTTNLLATGLDFNPFEMPVSIQACPHSASRYIRNAIRGLDVGRAWRYMREIRPCHNWVEAGKVLLNEVVANGGVWHLFGHSWEIEEMQQWQALQEMLDYACGHEDVVYATNGQVIEFLSSDRVPVNGEYARSPAVLG